MSFIDIFKKQKTIYTGSVIKLFKVISLHEVEQCVVPLKQIIDLHSSITQDDYNYIEINYGTKKWKRIQSLYRFLDGNQKYPIVYLSCYGKKSENNCLIYSNDLLNQTIKKELGVIEFIFSLHDIFIDEQYIMDFVSRAYLLFAFDYGYAFHLENKQDIVLENHIKKSLFSTSTFSNKAMIDEYSSIQKVASGYLPKLRKFNILNKQQINQSDITNVKKINDELFLYC